MVNDITSRFIKAYNSLIDSGQTSDKKDFADKIAVSPSMITEISKGRSNVGVMAIQNIVSVFKISSDWLLTGKGSMFKNEHQTELLSDPQGQYVEKKDDEIQFLKEIMTNQQKEIIETNKKLSESNAKLIDTNQKLVDRILELTADAKSSIAGSA